MITNTSDISLALAVWLVHDDYDRMEGIENYISATALMKPLRHIVLGPRVDRKAVSTDVGDLIPRAMGTALHDSVEKAWRTGYARSLRLLGYPQDLIDQVRINPTDDEVRGSNSILPIYIEQRAFRTIEVGGITYTIGGKFDLVTEGVIQDAKSTSAYSWVYGDKNDDYRLQMSIYRWIDAAQPMRKVTEDHGRINFIFTDWQAASARSNPKYPQRRVEQRNLTLLSVEETQSWIERKLRMIQQHVDTEEPEIPHCTPEELWQGASVYKYYSDPNKTAGRSTRNFDSMAEAQAFKIEKNGKGVVITSPGEPKRCNYCEAFSICTQKDGYSFA